MITKGLFPSLQSTFDLWIAMTHNVMGEPTMTFYCTLVNEASTSMIRNEILLRPIIIFGEGLITSSPGGANVFNILVNV